MACVPSGRYVLHLHAPRGGPPPFQSGFPRVVPPVVCRVLPLLALSHDWSTVYAIFLGALVTGPATSVVPSRGGHSGSGYASHRATAHQFFFFYISEYHVASRTGGDPLCLPCRYGFPAVLAFSRTGLYRHGVTAVLAFSRTGLIPPVLVIS